MTLRSLAASAAIAVFSLASLALPAASGEAPSAQPAPFQVAAAPGMKFDPVNVRSVFPEPCAMGCVALLNCGAALVFSNSGITSGPRTK